MSWLPPENPEPCEIIDSAKDDSTSGDYARSLAKHIWYHHNALSFRPSLSGVRLSYVLREWVVLGRLYKPARLALDEVREASVVKLLQLDRKSRRFFSLFHDTVSIDAALQESHRTVTLFRQLHDQERLSSHIYRLAQYALLQARAYQLCGQYLDPANSLKTAIYLLRYGLKYEAKYEDSVDSPPPYAEAAYIYETTTLMALLVKNGRKKEALEAKVKALEELDNATFRDGIKVALDGIIPERFY